MSKRSEVQGAIIILEFYLNCVNNSDHVREFCSVVRETSLLNLGMLDDE